MKETFFEKNTTEIGEEIQGCFEKVLTNPSQAKKRKAKAKDNEYQRFEKMMRDIIECDTKHFGNAFKYLHEEYATCTKTNITTHAVKRVRSWLRLKAYRHNTAENNAGNKILLVHIKVMLKHLFENGNLPQNGEGAYEQLEDWMDEVRARDDRNLGHLLNSENWFETMPMFIRMQHQIQEYNEERKVAAAEEEEARNENNDDGDNDDGVAKKKKKPHYRNKSKKAGKPKSKEPKPKRKKVDGPKINNFNLVPLCKSHRASILIDSDVLYHILCVIGKCPRKPNPKNTATTKQYESRDFTRERKMQWPKFINMDKIRCLGGPNRKFDYKIRSNGVNVSIIYKKQKGNQNQEATKTTAPAPRATIQKSGATKSQSKRDAKAIARERIAAAKTPSDYAQLIKDQIVKTVNAIDPGMRTWLAIVQRSTKDGREVSVHCTTFII